MKENNRGVTLIALAITIIVLLIISGITIIAGSYNAERTKDNKLLHITQKEQKIINFYQKL